MICTEVIIVGAGPVGLMVALGLAQQGISTIVLDSDPEPPRPLAADHLRSFHPLIAACTEGAACPPMRPYGCYKGAVSLHSHQALSVVPGVEGAGLPDGDGQGLRAALLEALASYSHVEVLWDHQLRELGQRESEARVLVQTDEGDCVIEGAYIVGADGVHSTVRRTLGMRWEPYDAGGTEGMRLLQFTVAADLSGAGCQPLHLMCDPSDWAVVGKTASVQEWQVLCAALATEGSAAKRAELRFAALFPHTAPSFAISEANSMIAHHRMAERYLVGKVVLAGDAAYEVPLWSGLGLASGLDDARCLAVALGALLRGGADGTVLDRYSADRKAAHTNKVAPKVAQLQGVLMSAAPDLAEWRRILGSCAAD